MFAPLEHVPTASPQQEEVTMNSNGVKALLHWNVSLISSNCHLIVEEVVKVFPNGKSSWFHSDVFILSHSAFAQK